MLIIVFGSFISLMFTDPGYVENKFNRKNNLLNLVENKVKLSEYCPMCVVNENYTY
jgi:hypothetical protein